MTISELIVSQVAAETPIANEVIKAVVRTGMTIEVSDLNDNGINLIAMSFKLEGDEKYYISGQTIAQLASGCEYLYENNMFLTF